MTKKKTTTRRTLLQAASGRTTEVATVHMQLELPTLPNFLRMRGCDGAVDIADIADDTLRQVGEYWTKALLARAQARRDMRG